MLVLLVLLLVVFCDLFAVLAVISLLVVCILWVLRDLTLFGCIIPTCGCCSCLIWFGFAGLLYCLLNVSVGRDSGVCLRFATNCCLL